MSLVEWILVIIGCVGFAVNVVLRWMGFDYDDPVLVIATIGYVLYILAVIGVIIGTSM